jgi:hypothetical protein
MDCPLHIQNDHFNFKIIILYTRDKEYIYI